MMVMNFLEWFETCPAWQALCLSLAGIAVIMAVEKLLCRLLAPAPAGVSRRFHHQADPSPEFSQEALEFDNPVPAT
jgi:hypothetical protein